MKEKDDKRKKERKWEILKVKMWMKEKKIENEWKKEKWIMKENERELWNEKEERGREKTHGHKIMPYQ